MSNATSTVKEVVPHAAHAAGGVHAGGPTEKSATIRRAASLQKKSLEALVTDEALEAAEDPGLADALRVMRRIAGVPDGLETLRAIGRVVYQSMIPLFDAVLRDLAAGGDIGDLEIKLPIPKGAAMRLRLDSPDGASLVDLFNEDQPTEPA